MAALPIRDRAGNALVDFRFVVEEELARLVEQVAVPASLVVVTHADAVLMMFDSWRKQWELPGGMREPGETMRQVAVRELREETGIHLVDLTFAAVAEFDLTKPKRRELLAVYRVQLQVVAPADRERRSAGFPVVAAIRTGERGHEPARRRDRQACGPLLDHLKADRLPLSSVSI